MGMAWEFDNGQKILIGAEKIKGINGGTHISGHTLALLHHKGYILLSETIKEWQAGCPIWKDAAELSLDSPSAEEWRGYVKNLSQVGLCYSVNIDYII